MNLLSKGILAIFGEQNSVQFCSYWICTKSAIVGDRETYRRIIKTDRLDEVKSLSRSIANFDETKWSEYKYEIVREGNFHKFNQSKKLRAYLLSTGNAVLAEANPSDNVWGIGLYKDEKLHPIHGRT